METCFSMIILSLQLVSSLVPVPTLAYQPSPQSSHLFISVRSKPAIHVKSLRNVDPLEELEGIAVNAADDCDMGNEPSEEEIERWQALFAYSYPEAVEQIKNHKSEYSCCEVSNDHWDLVKSQKMAEGCSREAYEHYIKGGGQSALSRHGGPFSRSTRPILQDEYPVWYSFYGALVDPIFLTRLLSLSDTEVPTLVSASIQNGMIETWNGRYKALVDGTSTDCVHGPAYEVTAREREDTSLIYETEKYEATRCITKAGQTVQGLIF